MGWSPRKRQRTFASACTATAKITPSSPSPTPRPAPAPQGWAWPWPMCATACSCCTTWIFKWSNATKRTPARGTCACPSPAPPPYPLPMHILIIDDEPLARSRLRHLLGDCTPHGEHWTMSEAASASQALPLLSGPLPVDIVLLDIQMPGANGMSFAFTLQQLPAPPAIIFVTAHSHYAAQAFDVQAGDCPRRPALALGAGGVYQGRAQNAHRPHHGGLPCAGRQLGRSGAALPRTRAAHSPQLLGQSGLFATPGICRARGLVSPSARYCPTLASLTAAGGGSAQNLNNL